MLVMGMAERITIRRGSIGYRDEIGLRCIFPAVLELLGNATAALTEAGITDFAIIHQDLSTSGLDSFHNMDIICFRDTLVALTMVIGAYIKDGMVVTIVPAYQLIIFLHEREEAVAAR